MSEDPEEAAVRSIAKRLGGCPASGRQSVSLSVFSWHSSRSRPMAADGLDSSESSIQHYLRSSHTTVYRRRRESCVNMTQSVSYPAALILATGKRNESAYVDVCIRHY